MSHFNRRAPDVPPGASRDMHEHRRFRNREFALSFLAGGYSFVSLAPLSHGRKGVVEGRQYLADERLFPSKPGRRSRSSNSSPTAVRTAANSSRSLTGLAEDAARRRIAVRRDAGDVPATVDGSWPRSIYTLEALGEKRSCRPRYSLRSTSSAWRSTTRRNSLTGQRARASIARRSRTCTTPSRCRAGSIARSNLRRLTTSGSADNASSTASSSRVQRRRDRMRPRPR